MLSGPQVGWDTASVNYHYDLTTKLTALYLLASGLVFAVSTLKFRMAAGRLKRLGSLQFAEHIALINLNKWACVTVLVLLVYSATECANLLWIISREKMIGTSALGGELARICSMWTAGLWLLVLLLIANWILSIRIRRFVETRRQTTDALREL